MLENITFKMNLVSRLAAADFPSGVVGNTDISEHTCTSIYHQQDPDNTDVLEVIFSKNCSLFFKNTSPYSRKQYFLSNEPSQPFGRSSLCTWQSSKLQHCETLWHCNISHSYKIWLLSKTPCTKTTRYLRLIFRQRMLENITFKINLVSRLAAADSASGVAGNIDISKRTCTIIYHQQDLDHIDILEVIFPKKARYFSKILHHIVKHNISFQMNLVSCLAAAVCAPGNHLNFNIAEHSDTVISHNNYKIWL